MPKKEKLPMIISVKKTIKVSVKVSSGDAEIIESAMKSIVGTRNCKTVIHTPGVSTVFEVTPPSDSNFQALKKFIGKVSK